MTIDQIRGWGAFDWLYSEWAASAEDGDVFVEIGIFCGKSIAFLARELINRGRKCRVIGIDPWIDDANNPHDYDHEDGLHRTWGAEHAPWCRSVGGPVNAMFASMHVHAKEELEYVQMWRMTSAEAYPSVKRIVAGGARVRGVLIDGDHAYRAVADDIMLYRPLTKVIAGDDYAHNFPGVRRAVHEAFLSPMPVVAGGFDRYTFDGQLPEGKYETNMAGKMLEIRGTTWVVR